MANVETSLPGRGLSEPGRARPQPAFYDDLAATLAEAWRLLKAGVSDRKSAFHVPTLATIGPDGAPSVRTVVLRSADPGRRLLRVHTDVRAAKTAEIEAEPRVAMHFYDPVKKIQLRVAGAAQLHRKDRLANQAWSATRPFSRICYRAESAPGTVIDRPQTDPMDPGIGTSEAARGNFAAVSISVHRIEWLYLAAQGHRRARFDWLERGLQATWLAP